MPTSEAKKRYDTQYAKDRLKRIPLNVQKDKYGKIKAAADAAGESINGYIKTAIDMRMENDTLSPNLFPAPTPPLPESPAAATRQEKQYQPFTDEDAKQIDLQKLLESMPYQIEVANCFGMDALAKLMEKARQQCTGAGEQQKVKSLQQPLL